MWTQRRYIMSILALFGFFTSMLLRFNLSIAIVAMTANNTKTDANGSVYYEKEFDWDSKVRGLLLSSFFYGYITTQLLGGWLAAKIGGTRVFGCGIAVTALFTTITPPLVRVNVYILVVCRIIEGIGEGIAFPAMHAIWASWVPPLERSKLAAVALSGNYFGAIFAMPICALMAERLGWPSLFYVCGIFGLVWFAVWSFVVAEKPEDDPHISDTELRYIKGSMEQATNEKIVHPWADIATSMPFWAIVAAHFSENWGLNTISTQLPTFLSDTLNYQLTRTGVLAALPHLLAAVISQGAGHLADYLRKRKILTTTQVRKFFTCGGFVSQSIFMLGTAFVMVPVSAVTCITIAIGLSGLAWVNFSVNYLDIAPKHASVMAGFGSTVAGIPGVVSPLLTGYIVQNGTAAEWKTVFVITAAIYLVGAMIYGLFASGELQPWAKKSKNENTMSLLKVIPNTHLKDPVEY